MCTASQETGFFFSLGMGGLDLGHVEGVDEERPGIRELELVCIVLRPELGVAQDVVRESDRDKLSLGALFHVRVPLEGKALVTARGGVWDLVFRHGAWCTVYFCGGERGGGGVGGKRGERGERGRWRKLDVVMKILVC